MPATDEDTVSQNEFDEETAPKMACTILVVEDDSISFSLVETYLSKENFELIHAKKGEEAIQLINENPEIDLVLMDIKMPGMDGYAATREIKKINKNIPVIAQTAYALEGDRQKAIEAGCDDYVSKPLRKSELIHKIKEIIGK